MASETTNQNHRIHTESYLLFPPPTKEESKKIETTLTDIFNQACTLQNKVNGYWHLPELGAKRFAKRIKWELIRCLITDKDLLDLAGSSSNISQLTLQDCPKLTDFPQIFLNILHLTKLNITDCPEITAIALKKLLESPGVQEVEELRLNQLNLTNAHLPLLYSFKNIKTLYLQRNSSLEAEPVAHLISKVKSLQEIHLEGCFIDYTSIQAFLSKETRNLTIYTGTVDVSQANCLTNTTPPLIQPKPYTVNLSYIHRLSKTGKTFPTDEELKKSYSPQGVGVLDLSYADITNEEFKTLLSRFRFIETLALYHNPHLTVEIVPLFQHLSKLKKFYVGGLDLIPPEALAEILKSLPQLEELCLRRICLEDMPLAGTILNLANLKTLNLCFCLLPQNLAGYIQKMPHLQTTLICSHDLKGSQQNITKTSTLRCVSLPQVIQNLQTFIHCDHHKKSEQDQSLQTIPSFNERLKTAYKDWAFFLGKINLSLKEEIEIETAFKICAKWEEKLKTTSSFWHTYAPSFNILELLLFIQSEIHNLEELHLANLRLPFLPDFILKTPLPKIKMINISGNLLQNSLHLFSKKNFPAVSQLFIQDSQLQTIPWEILNQLSLETWDLSHNHIKEITPPDSVQYPSLKNLNLSHNPLKNLPPTFWNFLSQFKDLSYIDLSSTGISYNHIPPEFQHKVITDS